MWTNNRQARDNTEDEYFTGAPNNAASLHVFHIRNSIEAIISISSVKCRRNSTKITSFYGKDLPETLPFESLHIQQCLNNLVSNAVRFTKNGHIQVRVLRHERNGNPYIAFNVIDNGCGISPACLPNLFKLHPTPRQCKPKYGVVESSLSVTNKLITDLGGHIVFKTRPNIGSVFTILLPYNADAINECPSIHSKGKKKLYQKYNDLRVLIVDDYNLNQVTIKTLLYDVTDKLYYASNGFEAFDVLYSCPIDLVLMDIHMPGMDGIETTMRIRESKQNWSKIFIAALSADPQYQLTHLCKKIGMDAALAKPIKKQNILQLFDEYLGIHHPACVK